MPLLYCCTKHNDQRSFSHIYLKEQSLFAHSVKMHFVEKKQQQQSDVLVIHKTQMQHLEGKQFPGEHHEFKYTWFTNSVVGQVHLFEHFLYKSVWYSTNNFWGNMPHIKTWEVDSSRNLSAVRRTLFFRGIVGLNFEQGYHWWLETCVRYWKGLALISALLIQNDTVLLIIK